MYLFGVPHLATYISIFSLKQDWVFTGIILAKTPFPISIWKRRDSNPRPFTCEPCSLTTTPSSHSFSSQCRYSQIHLWNENIHIRMNNPKIFFLSKCYFIFKYRSTGFYCDESLNHAICW